jgi:hypothetical protein
MALSAAERQRRYIEKLKRAAQAGGGQAEIDALAKQLAQAKARIAELEQKARARAGADGAQPQKRKAKRAKRQPGASPKSTRRLPRSSFY